MFEPSAAAFDADIDRFDDGRSAYTCVVLPPEILSRTGLRARFEGEIAGRDWAGGVQPDGAGRSFPIVAAKFLRMA